MPINRTRLSATLEPLATPTVAPATPPATPIVTEQRSQVESNGYLDPDQTLVNFAVRELGMSFQKLLQDDPALLLRKWLKCYRNSRAAAFCGTGLGAGAILAGVLIAASPLTVFGVLSAGGFALLAKHHDKGVKTCEIELTILDEIRPVLDLLAQLEARGANRSELVSLYDRLIRQYTAMNPLFGMSGNAAALKNFFDEELKKHQTLSQFLKTPTQFATAAAAPVAAQSPALQPATPTVAPATPPATLNLPAIDALDLVAAQSPATEAIAPDAKEFLAWEANPTAVPLQQRAQDVNAYLDAVGFPVGVIVHTPVALGYGGSQSGKSTILHLASILELAMGNKVVYINPDDDVPPIRFTSAYGGVGSIKALEMVARLTSTIDKASKDSLAGTTVFLDEWAKLARHERANNANNKAPIMQGYVNQLIEKGDKTGLRSRGAAQVKTLTALGLEGVSEAIGRDFLVIDALKTPATAFSREVASGRYECDRGNGKEGWVTPDTLKTVIRPDGKPDPVMSMLRWFPELRDDALVEKWMNPKQEEPQQPATQTALQPTQTALQAATLDDEWATEEELQPTSQPATPPATQQPVATADVDKAIAPILSYLKGKSEGKSLDDINRSTPLRNALGAANKSLTEAALQRLVSQSLLIEERGVYRRNEAVLSA